MVWWSSSGDWSSGSRDWDSARDRSSWTEPQGRPKQKAKASPKASTGGPQGRPKPKAKAKVLPTGGGNEEEEEMNSRMRREENRAPMRIEMQEPRRVVHTQEQQLAEVPRLRAEYLAAVEQRTEARTALKFQEQMGWGAANMWSASTAEMRELEASTSSLQEELQASEHVAEELAAKEKCLAEELQAKDLAVAEQIKRGRSWWLRSKSLEGELQAKETEMMENRETYRELKALNAMESRREEQAIHKAMTFNEEMSQLAEKLSKTSLVVSAQEREIVARRTEATVKELRQELETAQATAMMHAATSEEDAAEVQRLRQQQLEVSKEAAEHRGAEAATLRRELQVKEALQV
eukprot:s4848_g6.t1